MHKLTKGGCLLKSQKALLLSPRNKNATESKSQDRMTTYPCTLLSVGLEVLHKPFSCSFTNCSSRNFVACQDTRCLGVVVHAEGP